VTAFYRRPSSEELPIPQEILEAAAEIADLSDSDGLLLVCIGTPARRPRESVDDPEYDDAY
jgi:hypothetical protein